MVARLLFSPSFLWTFVVVIVAVGFAASVLWYLVCRERWWREAGRYGVVDWVTGIGNRPELERYADVCHRAGKRCELLFVDLDGFKAVNGGSGHDVGDQVLRVVAGRLAAAAGYCDGRAYRRGGDEFVAVVREGERYIAELQTVFRQPVRLSSGSTPLWLGASVGRVRLEDFPTARAALKAAETAMYRAKDRTRSPGDAVIVERGSTIRERGPRTDRSREPADVDRRPVGRRSAIHDGR